MRNCEHQTKSLVGSSASRLKDDINSGNDATHPSFPLPLFAPRLCLELWRVSTKRSLPPCLLILLAPTLAHKRALQELLCQLRSLLVRGDTFSQASPRSNGNMRSLGLLVPLPACFDNTVKSMLSRSREHLFLLPCTKKPMMAEPGGYKHLTLDSLKAPLTLLNGNALA